MIAKITNIEFYISHSTNNSVSTLNVTLNIVLIKNGSESVSQQQFTNLDIATVSFKDLTSTINCEKNDKVKIQLILNTNQNGHEIFVRLQGHAKIHPNVDKLHILDTSDADEVAPAFLCNGGGKFLKTISSQSVGNFTGSHISTMITPTNYDLTYTYYYNNTNVFKSGLIVSIDTSTKTHITDSEFNIKVTDTIVDKTVFGVINSYLGNKKYCINSLGEGAIWVSNINGNISNGDYITSSKILGYGCRQNDDILHSYTVAKCCSVIDWNSVNSYINYYNSQYKIVLVACTYHCG